MQATGGYGRFTPRPESGLIGKLIVFALCMAMYFQHNLDGYAVVAVIAAVTVSGLCEYLTADAAKAAVFSAYIVAAVFYPPFVFFLPLASYDVWRARPRWLAFLWPVPLIAHLSRFSPVFLALIAVYTALAWLLRHQALSLQKQHSEYITLQDNAKEFSTDMLEKNRELLEKQDYEINLATLRERNRIAREMHDSVGHILSSSLLQLGALLATCRDDSQRQSLECLKDTLSRGMDSVRSAIHGLHDESIDLFAEIQTLAQGFSFCPVSFDYDVEEGLESKMKYAFLSIVKEALSNVAKHSNATRVNITIREHPALYQLVVRDNGTKRAGARDEGLGLKNIHDRAESLGGLVHIGDEDGFTLFISVPKKPPNILMEAREAQ